MTKRKAPGILGSPIWQNARFVRLWLAQTISLIGDQIYLIALPWLVYNITQSASHMSLVFTFEMLPYLVFSLIGGVLSDKWNRKYMLVLGHLLAMIPLLLIYFLYITDRLEIWHIYAGSFLLSCIVSIVLPAFESSIPSTVKKEELVHANSLTEVTTSFTTLLGPLISGIIISFVGVDLSLLLNGLSFLLAGLIFMTLKNEVVTNKERPTLSSVFLAFKEGFVFVAGHRIIRVGVLLSTVNNITIGAYTAILIFHMRDTLGLSAEATGLVMTLSSVASLLISALVAPSLGQKIPKGLTMIGSLALSGVGIACVGLSSGLITLVIAQGLYTGSITLFTINWRSLRQEITPSTMIGRVSGVCRGVAFAGASMGGLLGGATLARFDHTSLLVVEGLIICLLSLSMMNSPLRQKRNVPAETHAAN